MAILSQMGPGTSAVVVGVAADPAVARRLASLGFRPGTAVSCVRRAPMGDPTVYRLRSYEVCLRRREAGYVTVDASQEAGHLEAGHLEAGHLEAGHLEAGDVTVGSA